MSRLQKEIKQRKPFSSPQEEAYLNLLRTADFLTYQSAELLRARNLTPSGYNVLRILRGAGEEGLPSGEIGSRMLTRMPDMTRVLDRLEEMRLVERFRTAGDRRVVRARITDPARELLDDLDPAIRKLHCRQMRPLTPSELACFVGFLERLRCGLTDTAGSFKTESPARRVRSVGKNERGI